MKIKKVEFYEHEILSNLEVDFCNDKQESLNTVIIIGENGSGKTTLLKEIFKSFCTHKELWTFVGKDEIKISVPKGDIFFEVDELEKGLIFNHPRIKEGIVKGWLGKIVFMPTEINFDKLNKVDNTFKFSHEFLNVIDQNITENIPSLIATKINKEIFKNRNKVIGEVIDEVCDNINSIFRCMDLEVKLIGLSEDEDNKPIFKNTQGKEFDINGLSSGEKQLFLRALSLKFLEVNNSIVLIDEPEISLHPQWQQKIINVYESIGENNQIIIATHSPHIVGYIESSQLRILKKDANGISVMKNHEIKEGFDRYIRGI